MYNLRMNIVYMSLAVNILVAGFWGSVLFRNSYPNLSKVFGSDSPGLRILSSLYSAIAVASVIAVIFPEYTIAIVSVLFPLQIFYKLLSVVAVKNIKNPVVVSNVFIALLHSVSLYMLYL